jgi:uncharacterized protein YciI
MKKLFFLIFVFKTISLSAQQVLPLYWLAGKWQVTSQTGTIYENWSIRDDSTLVGFSYKIKTNGDSIALESVELRRRNGTFYYIPTVKEQNQGKPVEFTCTHASDVEFVFENPQHDFPKKVTYRFIKEKNNLEARIEGGKKQQSRLYAKISQPQAFPMKENDGKEYTMKQYFVCFLKKGTHRSHSKEEAGKIQEAHLNHLTNMYNLGLISLVGPYGDDGDIRGMTVFNVANIEEAIWWANQDPAVKSGRLTVEVHPWWTASGRQLR